MSKLDLESIIQSPEAETFLGMVTKGFYDNSYIGLWIYEVIGREWDEMHEWAEGLKKEIQPQTCTWSIDIWEWLYGIEPGEGLTLEYRRQRVLSKILGVKPINPEVIRRGVNKLLGSSNGWAEVHDCVEPYCFEVILNLTGHKPLNYAEILNFIHEIKPAHLKMLITAISRFDTKFPNKEHFQPISLLMPFYFSNQPNDITLLNGRRSLDGSWKLDSTFRGVVMRSFELYMVWQERQKIERGALLVPGIILPNRERSVWSGLSWHGRLANRTGASSKSLGLKSNFDGRQTSAMAGGSLTKDTMWRLDGSARLDGSKKLNAAIIKEMI